MIKKFNEFITENMDDFDENDFEIEEVAMTVQELIDELKTCDPNSKVYYTLGGSNNYGPVNYFEDDSHELDEEDQPGVLLGELTW